MIQNSSLVLQRIPKNYRLANTQRDKNLRKSSFKDFLTEYLILQ